MAFHPRHSSHHGGGFAGPRNSRTGGLPLSRRDADVETRERWMGYYAGLLRERVTEAGGPGQSGLDLVGHLFPLLHSVCCWMSVEDTCLWVREESGVEISAGSLRTALRYPADRWALLWREVRDSLRVLVRVHGWRPEEILWGEHVITRLKDQEPHVKLGNLHQTQVMLAAVRQARAELQKRWYAWEPRTRDSARSYLGLVCARREDDF